MNKAYYNEHDKNAAAWLRELIKAGLIAPGEVDERSIEDILPSELDGFTQCHFFAGIGVWSYALRCAGWPDDRKVWTGSCPCQPFSAAGKGGGTDDERHLWPSFFWLIKQCQPSIVFGEQVASKDGLAWLDIVQSDLEAEKYAVAPFDLCAAGFGAPHIRQRLFFVADSGFAASQRNAGSILEPQTQGSGKRFINGNLPERFADGGTVGSLADADGKQTDTANERRLHAEPVSYCALGELGNTATDGRKERQWKDGQPHAGGIGESRIHAIGAGATNGFWRDAEWLYCRDEKYRAVEPVNEPMANGIADDLGLVRLASYPNRENEERLIVSPLIAQGKKRVLRLKGYGNAIVAPVAEEFIKAYLATA
jgi:DNA (cytosine-5)-methyltransferase 1